jgi:hypothetical protein
MASSTNHSTFDELHYYFWFKHRPRDKLVSQMKSITTVGKTSTDPNPQFVLSNKIPSLLAT